MGVAGIVESQKMLLENCGYSFAENAKNQDS
jgi:hypothetical protein